MHEFFLKLQFNLPSTIFACAWRVCSGPLCGYPPKIPPSLGGTIQRRQLLAPRFLGDPLQVRACSGTEFFLQKPFFEVDCLAFRQHGQPILFVLYVRGSMHRMLVRYRTSVFRILSSHLMWRSLEKQLKGLLLRCKACILNY